MRLRKRRRYLVKLYIWVSMTWNGAVFVCVEVCTSHGNHTQHVLNVLCGFCPHRGRCGFSKIRLVMQISGT